MLLSFSALFLDASWIHFVFEQRFRCKEHKVMCEGPAIWRFDIKSQKGKVNNPITLFDGHFMCLFQFHIQK